MSTLTNKVKTTLCKTAVAAGTTDITDATAVCMDGFESVRFIFLLGTITSGAATSAAASMLDTSSPTPGTDDVAGSKITIVDTADDTIVILDIVKPGKRYVRPFLKRATQNAVLNGIIAEQYEHAGKMPITKDASVTLQTLLIGPINGTA
jgi:hypothetical protein